MRPMIPPTRRVPGKCPRCPLVLLLRRYYDSSSFSFFLMAFTSVSSGSRSMSS